MLRLPSQQFPRLVNPQKRLVPLPSFSALHVGVSSVGKHRAGSVSGIPQKIRAKASNPLQKDLVLGSHNGIRIRDDKSVVSRCQRAGWLRGDHGFQDGVGAVTGVDVAPKVPEAVPRAILPFLKVGVVPRRRVL